MESGSRGESEAGGGAADRSPEGDRRRSWVPWFWEIPQWELEEQVAEYRTLGWAKSYRRFSALLLLTAAALGIVILLALRGPSTLAGTVFAGLVYGILAVFVYRGSKVAMILAMVLWTADRGLNLLNTLWNPLSWLVNLALWMLFMDRLWKALSIERARKKIAIANRFS